MIDNDFGCALVEPYVLLLLATMLSKLQRRIESEASHGRSGGGWRQQRELAQNADVRGVGDREC